MPNNLNNTIFIKYSEHLQEPLSEAITLWQSDNQRIKRFKELIEELKTLIYDEVESMRFHSEDMNMDMGIELNDNNE